MMTRKDYVTTARILYLQKDYIQHGTYLDLVFEFCDWFKEDNPNFNEIKFQQACGLDIVSGSYAEK